MLLAESSMPPTGLLNFFGPYCLASLRKKSVAMEKIINIKSEEPKFPDWLQETDGRKDRPNFRVVNPCLKY